MATLGFTDSDGVDLGNKYVTKDYVMTWYPNLPSSMVAPQLWGWGGDQYGQLGDSTLINKSYPVQTVSGGTNWKQVSGGALHAAAIKTDGTLWSWGGFPSGWGTLGNGTTAYNSSPVQTIAGGTNWASVSCGRYHTIAIKTDGTLWNWGNNQDGSLGDNTTTHKTSPVQTIAGGTTWKQAAGGYMHSAAIKSDGTLWLWGSDNYGQLGNNSTTKVSSPIQTVSGGTNWTFVATGEHTAAIKTDGSLWVWGLNYYGQLGNSTNLGGYTANPSPVQVISGTTNWKTVACGRFHTVAIKTDGTLWSWGRNNYGQLGDNTNTPTSSPIQTVAGGTNWKQIAGGYHFTAAIKTDGSLWLWGRNDVGMLGNNTTVPSSSPIQTAAGGINWKQVACGYYNPLAISEASGW